MENALRALWISLLGVALAASSISTSPAQDAASQAAPTRILVNPGQTTQTINGSLRGYESRRFTFEARAGQQMDVRLTSNNRFPYFNVLDPRGNAIFTGSGSVNPGTFSDRLALSGNHTIDVYLMRAQRQNSVVHARCNGI